MILNYEKHTYPCWNGQCDPVSSLVPDCILEPLFSGLEGAKLTIDRNRLSAVCDQAISGQRWPWDRTLLFVRECLDDVGGKAVVAAFDVAHTEKPTKLYSKSRNPRMVTPAVSSHTSHSLDHADQRRRHDTSAPRDPCLPLLFSEYPYTSNRGVILRQSAGAKIRSRAPPLTIKQNQAVSKSRNCGANLCVL